MSSADTSGLADSGKTWDDLTAIVARFVNRWDAGGEAPTLGPFLPESPPAFRRVVLVELIKIDLEYRSTRKTPRRIEEYLADFPELTAGGVPSDLMYEEYYVRKQAGEPITVTEYQARFPEQAEELGRLLGVSGGSTTLVGKMPTPTIIAGERLDDFDLLRVLGEGAFAKVFLAWQRSMQRQVALKVSAQRGSEAATLAQLDHRHIVRVYDQRQVPEQGLQLLYMQPIAGGTLQQVITHMRSLRPEQRNGAAFLNAVAIHLRQTGVTPKEDAGRRGARLASLTWPEVVCWIGMRLADALDYANRHGVLHRDIKPANVLLTEDGEPMLTDFNVSYGSKLEGASPAAFFGGSLAYMSPEQLDAFNPQHAAGPESLDARSDLYSLGVMLWELLTGQRPFPEDKLEPGWNTTLGELARRRRAGLSDAGLPAACPPGLARALRICLAPDPAARFSSGKELARALALGLHPRAEALLGEASGWRKAARRFPIAALLLAGLWPNVAAALFNFIYNRAEIIGHLEKAETAFWYVQLAINGVAFPVGISIVVWLGWPVAHAQAESAKYAWVRRRCLLLGHWTALVSLTAWVTAGMIYPVCMAWALGGMPWSVVLHFLASLALCGLIAVAYPFFSVTILAVRAWYPALASVDGDDHAPLSRLGRLLNGYLLLAAVVPMLGVLILVLIGTENRAVLAVLSAAGLAGFGLAFWLQRVLAADLQALQLALRPMGELLEREG